MSSELDDLRRASDDHAEALAFEVAREANAAILDLVPGDPVATNRLAIGLMNAGRAAEAIPVLEAGLLVHPDNAIAEKRLKEATVQAKKPNPKAKAASGGGGAGWIDFEPAELIASSLGGPGYETCVRFCADALRLSEAMDLGKTAVTPVKNGHRFRIIGGIFTGVAPYKDQLTVAVPTHSKSLIGSVLELGGTVYDTAAAVPSTQVGIPRGRVDDLYDDLLKGFKQHLGPSIEFGPPTHLNKHHAELRAYLLAEAKRLAGS